MQSTSFYVEYFSLNEFRKGSEFVARKIGQEIIRPTSHAGQRFLDQKLI